MPEVQVWQPVSTVSDNPRHNMHPCQQRLNVFIVLPRAHRADAMTRSTGSAFTAPDLRLADQPTKVFRFPIVIGCGGRQN
jgi:hypothetical protein